MLDPSWRNLAVGCKRAVQLEAALRERWPAPIQQAEQRALSRWQIREAARRSTFDELWGKWSVQDSLNRRRLGTRALMVLPALLAIALAGVLLASSSPARAGIALLAALVAGLTLLTPARHLLTHRAQRPVYPTDDPEPAAQFEAEPIYPGDEAPPPRPHPIPASALDRRTALSLELARHWWREVQADARRSDQGYAHGDEGVSLFIDALNSRLSSDYFVVRDLLVRKSLDVDVLVVGPSGVWVFEVKHWSGRIVCRNGDWHRERTYHEPGGFEATDVNDISAFDRQWQREVEAMTTTLNRRLKAPVAGAATARGGLVFSHHNAHWEIDASCGAGYGPPWFWVDTLAREPSLPAFNQDEQLRVLDALFTWSRKLEGAEHSRCAERLANELHDKIDAAAGEYVRRLDAT